MRWLLIALIVIPGTIADVLNTMGMKRNGEVCDFRQLNFPVNRFPRTQSLYCCWRASHGSFFSR